MASVGNNGLIMMERSVDIRRDGSRTFFALIFFARTTVNTVKLAYVKSFDSWVMFEVLSVVAVIERRHS